MERDEWIAAVKAALERIQTRVAAADGPLRTLQVDAVDWAYMADIDPAIAAVLITLEDGIAVQYRRLENLGIGAFNAGARR